MKNEYFAAVNSYEGFKSFYKDIFGNLNRLYIIKGGPGTGKSTLMRKVADEAGIQGYNVEFFYCSSDPTSLDGVIISSLGIGIVDGTAPHLMDADLPGARDEIVNLCDFWKSEKLRESRSDIELLNKRKSAGYSTVFSYLAAIGNINRNKNSVLDSAIDYEKTDNFSRRFARTNISKKSADISGEINSASDIRVIEALGMFGKKYLTSFEEASDTHYFISDRCGIAPILLRNILKRLSECGCRTIVGIGAPSGEICGLLLPDKSISISVLRPENEHFANTDETETSPRIISTERFIQKDIFKTVKPHIKRAEKYIDILMQEAENAFIDIRTNHFAIEDIYKDAMDFRKEDEYTKKLIKKIFSKK